MIECELQKHNDHLSTHATRQWHNFLSSWVCTTLCT